MLDQKYVEFDFRIGQILVIFQFLRTVNETCKVNHMPTPKLIHIIFTKFNHNYHGTFRNSSNPLTLYEIALFYMLISLLFIDENAE